LASKRTFFLSGSTRASLRIAIPLSTRKMVMTKLKLSPLPRIPNPIAPISIDKTRLRAKANDLFHHRAATKRTVLRLDRAREL